MAYSHSRINIKTKSGESFTIRYPEGLYPSNGKEQEANKIAKLIAASPDCASCEIETHYTTWVEGETEETSGYVFDSKNETIK